jgi:hypothetical protein
MLGELIGLVAVVCIFGWPIIALFLNHQRKMAEINGGGGKNGQMVLSELQEMKRQIAELRDTTTRYDMSFDTALQRIESRVGTVEQRVQTIEQSPNQTSLIQ